jgi:hypothetical protein
LTAFEAAVAKAFNGGTADTQARDNARLILANLLRLLASYVQVTCEGDMTKLILSGFPTQKPVRTPIGVLPPPVNPVLSLGKQSGELDGSVNPLFGAYTYNWRLMPNTPGAVPLTAQSTASSFTFTNLTPGMTYTLTVNAVGAAGTSDWSNPANQMAV